MMDASAIGVIGGGLMGHGIAYLFATAGHPVGVFEPAVEVRAAMAKRLAAIPPLLGDDPACLARIALHERMAPAVAGAAFVFEAAPESLPLKQRIFAELEALASSSTIFASNSSAIPTTEIGRGLRHRDRVVGTHFWNPPHLVPLVEVIQNEATSDATVARTMALLQQVGKNAVHVRRDIPGFIGNRLQHALKREAIALLAAGVADAETIDTVIKDGFGARLAVLGALEQSDLVGLDLTLAIQETLIRHLDRSAEPQALLREKVATGKVGMRTGEGFRSWTPEQADEVRRRLNAHLVEQAKLRRRQHRCGQE